VSTPAARGLVLVVEDERSISDLIRLYLGREGYGVHVEADGRLGLEAARRLRPVAIILDVGLPTMDGTEVCRTLRGEGNDVPILFVTARDDEVERVLGLELGADDYLTKPFSPRELVARVRAAHRRASGMVTSGVEQLLELGPVRVDRNTRRVTIAGSEVDFTTTEFDLLTYLMNRPGRVATRDELLSQVWGYANAVGSRTVDVHVAQVRSKLGPASTLLRTVRGVGYSVDLRGLDDEPL